MKKSIQKTENQESILGDKHADFLSGAKAESHILGKSLQGIHEMFDDYGYSVCSWPILIDEDRTQKMGKICVELPRLLDQLIQMYFENDIQRIADYYFQGNTMYAELALNAHNKKHQFSYRLDLMLGQSGFKVLEANIGSAIGGYEVFYFQQPISSMHNPLSDPRTKNNYHCRDTAAHYMKFIVDQILEHIEGVTDTLNIFASFKAGEKSDNIIQVPIIHEALVKELEQRGLKGGAYACRFDLLKTHNGALFLEEKRMHGVIMLHPPENVPPMIFRSFMSNKLYYPDHFGVEIMLSDKRNLGLLRDLAIAGKFNERDTEIIMHYIPWTAEVEENKTVLYENKDYDMLELLRSHKANFVIKDANGSQGKNVFVGKFTSSEDWEMAIQLALGNIPFIAQEFTESFDFLAPNASNTWVPYKLIWGAFGFSDQYGGVFVRMSEAEAGLDVINAAKGAIEAIVYEYT